MAKVHPIEKELSTALELRRKANESDAAFAVRLHEAATECEKSVWEDLSEEAQAWVNAATDAADENEELPGYDDVPEEAEEKPKKGTKGKASKDDDADPDDEDPAEKSKKGTKSKSKEVDEDEDEKPKRKASKDGDDDEKPKKNGSRHSGNKLQAIQDATWDAGGEGTLDDVVKALKKAKIDAAESTIPSIRGAYIRALKHAASKGLKKGNPFA